jgi:hypothetical protein
MGGRRIVRFFIVGFAAKTWSNDGFWEVKISLRTAENGVVSRRVV